MTGSWRRTCESDRSMSSTIWFDRLSRNWMQRHHQLVTDRIVESTDGVLAG
jgi:hypothetical protein